jgi:hypothetical protein
MSSYLNIYLQEKGSEKKILLTSYSRSTDMYQTVWEELNPAYIGMEGDHYTELTVENLTQVINNLNDEISKHRNKLDYMEKIITQNADREMVQDILDLKEMIDDLKSVRQELDFYKDIAEDIRMEINGFSGIFCNID